MEWIRAEIIESHSPRWDSPFPESKSRTFYFLSLYGRDPVVSRRGTGNTLTNVGCCSLKSENNATRSARRGWEKWRSELENGTRPLFKWAACTCRINASSTYCKCITLLGVISRDVEILHRRRIPSMYMCVCVCTVVFITRRWYRH